MADYSEVQMHKESNQHVTRLSLIWKPYEIGFLFLTGFNITYLN